MAYTPNYDQVKGRHNYAKASHQFEAEAFDLCGFITRYEMAPDEADHALLMDGTPLHDAVKREIWHYEETLKRLGLLEAVEAEFERLTVPFDLYKFNASLGMN
jgi:hypothetical protein